MFLDWSCEQSLRGLRVRMNTQPVFSLGIYSGHLNIDYKILLRRSLHVTFSKIGAGKEEWRGKGKEGEGGNTTQS